jgi:hypothetical protein
VQQIKRAISSSGTKFPAYFPHCLQQAAFLSLLLLNFAHSRWIIRFANAHAALLIKNDFEQGCSLGARVCVFY